MQQLIVLKLLIWVLLYLGCCLSLNFTNQNYDGIQVGVPFTLTWEDAQGAVELGLLFRLNASSPQNTTIIASGITDSQFVWTPPDWTSGAVAQKIEAQDDAKNLALTGYFTTAQAADLASSAQQTTNTASTRLSSSVAAKTADSQSGSSNISAATRDVPSSTAKVRVGFGICIVVVLVIIGVALIFFEHGKRVAARTEQRHQPTSPFERAEQGSMGLELVETNLTSSKIEKETVEEESATTLLYKKPKLDVELERGMTTNASKGAGLEFHEERGKKILSVGSIYELG